MEIDYEKLIDGLNTYDTSRLEGRDIKNGMIRIALDDTLSDLGFSTTDHQGVLRIINALDKSFLEHFISRLY